MNTPKKNVQLCFCVQLSVSYLPQKEISDTVANYKAFFSGIQAMEKLPLTVYASGSFLESQKGKQHAYLMVLKNMLARKQIELLGGGYYEPYFSIIPPSDTVGQIELMTAVLRTQFGKRPRGLFLTGSVWVPSLIGSFNKCGMEYCLLDHRFFPHASDGRIKLAPVTLEDNGKTVTAFPYIDGDANIAEQSPDAFYETIAAFGRESEETVYLLFLPLKAYIKCMEKNRDGSSWLASFIERCSRPDSTVALTHTASLMKNKQPHTPVYIAPNAVLCGQPSGQSAKRTILHHWQAFRLYTKMMYVNMLVNGMKGDKPRKKYALQELWKAQSAELFALDRCEAGFHREVRRAAYRKLLVAEKQTRLPGVFTDGLVRYDIDLDGFKECLSQRQMMNMYVHHCGGKIIECDVFSAYKNYSDLPLEQSGMFIDYLLTESALQQLQAGNTEGLTAVFSENSYQEIELNTIRSELKLSTVGFFDAVRQPVLLRKQYTFLSQGAQIQYILKNDSPLNLSSYFTVEVDIALDAAGDSAPSLSLYDGVENQKRESGIVFDVFHKVSWIQLEDPEGKTQFTLEANEEPDLIILPIYRTDSFGGTGQGQNIYGIRLFFYWKVDLNLGYETEKMLFFEVKDRKN